MSYSTGGVGLGIADGGGYLGAVGQVPGDGGSEGAPCTVEFPWQPGLRILTDKLAVTPQTVDDLGGFLMAAGDKHVVGAMSHQLLGTGVQGIGVAAQGMSLNGVGGDNGSQGHQQVHQGVRQAVFRQRATATGSQHRIENDGNVPIVQQQGMDRFHVLHAGGHAYLERRHRHVLKDNPGLLDQEGGRDRLEILHADAVLGGEGGDHGARVAAEAGEGFHIRLNPRAAAGVMTGQNQHDGRGGRGGCSAHCRWSFLAGRGV